MMKLDHGGSLVVLWQDFLLWYGAHSEHLIEAIGELAWCPANNVVKKERHLCSDG